MSYEHQSLFKMDAAEMDAAEGIGQLIEEAMKTQDPRKLYMTEDERGALFTHMMVMLDDKTKKQRKSKVKENEHKNKQSYSRLSTGRLGHVKGNTSCNEDGLPPMMPQHGFMCPGWPPPMAMAGVPMMYPPIPPFGRTW